MKKESADWGGMILGFKNGGFELRGGDGVILYLTEMERKTKVLILIFN